MTLSSRERTLAKYGLTLDSFADMLKEQGGTCWICGSPPKQSKKTGKTPNLCVDHNHKSGKVRGLLCRMCNKEHVGRMERRKNPRIIAQRTHEYFETFGTCKD